MSNIHVVKVPVEERVRLALLRDPNKTPHRIADCIKGANTVMVKEIKATMAGLATPPPPAQARSPLVSLESLKAKFDTAGAIRRELAALPKGKLIPEYELRQLVCGYDANRFRRAVENNADEFRPNRVKLRIDKASDGKWFWGCVEDVAELERARDL